MQQALASNPEPLEESFPPMHPRKLIRDSLRFAASLSVVRMALMARGLIAARLLGPMGYGAWNALQLMMDYGVFAAAGTQQGLDQAVPARIVANDPAALKRLKRAGFTNILFTTLLFIAGCMIWASSGSSRLLGTWGFGGIALALFCVLAVNIAYYGLSLLRSHGDMTTVSTWFVLQGLIGAGLGLALVPRLGEWGLLWGWVAGCLVSLLFVLVRGRREAPLQWAVGPENLQLVRIGLPMFVFSSSTLVMRSLDRLIILRYLGTQDLGYYSLSVMALTFLLYLPDSVGYVVYPQLLRRYGEAGEDATAIRGRVERLLQAMAVSVPLLSGLAFLWTREIVALVLPQFLPGVTAVRILCFGAGGLALGTIASLVLMTVGRRMALVPAAVFATALGATLDIVAVRLGFGITGVAWATLATYALNGGLLLTMASAGVGHDSRRTLSFVFSNLMPLAIGILLAWGIDRTMPWMHATQMGLRLARLALGSLAFIVLYIVAVTPFARGVGLKQLVSEFNLPILSPLFRRLGFGSES